MLGEANYTVGEIGYTRRDSRGIRQRRRGHADTPGGNDVGYNGLTDLTLGLPADAYFDPRQYERELQRIWYRNWVYVGRSSDLAGARSFQTFALGDQKILLVRDDAGVLQRLSQHLPASRRGVVPRVRRRAAKRQHRLPVPCLGLQSAGRFTAHLLEEPRQRLRCGRFPAVPGQGQGMERLRVRCA